MMPRTGQVLHRLQLLDTALAEQLSKLREAEGQLGESVEVKGVRQTHRQAGQDLATWQGRLRDLEFELDTLTGRLAATEQRLYSGQVTNPKELTGLEKDLEYLRRARSKLEDEVLLSMTGVEGCQKALAEASTRRVAVEGKWQSEQERLGRQVEQLRAKVAVLRQDRTGQVAGLQAAEVALYEELLRKKGGRAVALLVGDMCQGCRVTLPSSRVQVVRRGLELVVCTNCGRILIAEQ